MIVCPYERLALKPTAAIEQTDRGYRAGTGAPRSPGTRANVFSCKRWRLLGIDTVAPDKSTHLSSSPDTGEEEIYSPTTKEENRHESCELKWWKSKVSKGAEQHRHSLNPEKS